MSSELQDLIQPSDLARVPPPALVRVERDMVGELALPADALYGIHTARAVAALSFSGKTLGQYPRLVAALGTVKVATAKANGEADVMPGALADAVAYAAAELAAGRFLEACIVDPLGGGGSIGVHMNANEVLANRANELLGGQRGDVGPADARRHVGASQSTADVMHTAFRLAVFDAVDELGTAVARAEVALLAFIERCGQVPTLARTCLQDGLSVPVSVLFDGTRTSLYRRRNALAAAMGPLLDVVLGSTVIGTGDGAPARYAERVIPLLAEASHRPVQRSTMPAAALQSSDDLAAVSSRLVALADTLAKLAQDLRWLSSGPAGGIGEVVLPHVIEGSSFFAAKRNPVVPETVLAAAMSVRGHDRTVQEAMARAELQLNVFDNVVAIAVLDAAAALTQATNRLTDHCLVGLDVDEERCRELAALAAPRKEG